MLLLSAEDLIIYVGYITTFFMYLTSAAESQLTKDKNHVRVAGEEFDTFLRNHVHSFPMQIPEQKLEEFYKLYRHARHEPKVPVLLISSAANILIRYAWSLVCGKDSVFYLYVSNCSMTADDLKKEDLILCDICSRLIKTVT